MRGGIGREPADRLGAGRKRGRRPVLGADRQCRPRGDRRRGGPMHDPGDVDPDPSSCPEAARQAAGPVGRGKVSAPRAAGRRDRRSARRAGGGLRAGVSEEPGENLDEERVRSRWPQSRRHRRLGPRLFLVEGVSARPGPERRGSRVAGLRMTSAPASRPKACWPRPASRRPGPGSHRPDRPRHVILGEGKPRDAVGCSSSAGPGRPARRRGPRVRHQGQPGPGLVARPAACAGPAAFRTGIWPMPGPPAISWPRSSRWSGSDWLRRSWATPAGP